MFKAIFLQLEVGDFCEYLHNSQWLMARVKKKHSDLPARVDLTVPGVGVVTVKSLQLEFSNIVRQTIQPTPGDTVEVRHLNQWFTGEIESISAEDDLVIINIFGGETIILRLSEAFNTNRLRILSQPQTELIMTA